MGNALYFGDNLEWLRDRSHFPDGCVDLIYLDPPFNSNANYSKIFSEPGGGQSQAQIRAFDDTWDWEGASSGEALAQIAKAGETDVASFVEWVAGRGNGVSKGMAAYLAMMAVRLIELERVLKPTGSIYLHCDPTASHYLKLLMDTVFGGACFRNEIVWKRSVGHHSAKRWGPNCDNILFYTKSETYTWNPQFERHDPKYVERFYRFTETDGRKYRVDNLTAAATRTGPSGQPWRGIDPTAVGRHWAVPVNFVEELAGRQKAAEMNTQQKLDLLDQHSLIHWPAKGRMPGVKRYWDPNTQGVPLQALWTDVPVIAAHAQERLGYPTQKPLALLERIIRASSNEGDVVLDPFCGCGTAVIAAHRLKRRWLGIDVTYLAIDLVEDRLHKEFPSSANGSYEVYGRPKDEASARRLMEHRNKQFEIWAISLVGAHPREHDGGVDGVYTVMEGATARKVAKVVVQVKGGRNLNPGMVRDLLGTVEKEKAVMGLLITLEPPTSGMKELAAHSGFYLSPSSGKEYQRIQVRTIGELLAGNKFDLPAGRRPW